MSHFTISDAVTLFAIGQVVRIDLQIVRKTSTSGLPANRKFRLGFLKMFSNNLFWHKSTLAVPKYFPPNFGYFQKLESGNT